MWKCPDNCTITCAHYMECSKIWDIYSFPLNEKDPQTLDFIEDMRDDDGDPLEIEAPFCPECGKKLTWNPPKWGKGAKKIEM